MIRVLVCGGREYGIVPRGCPPNPEHEARRRAWREALLLEMTLDEIHVDRRIACVIHGAATGADTLAAHWARRKLLHAESYPADWRGLGPAAGPIRNGRMLREGRPDLVVAFPGGAGTRNMIAQAERAGFTVRRIEL